MQQGENKTITSTQNELIKYCTKLQDAKFRKQEKMIFIDGTKTILGLVSEGFVFEYVFYSKNYPLPQNIKFKNKIEVSDNVLSKISTLKTPSGIVAILKEPEFDNTRFYSMGKIALIENIKDPGNLGTIIRSAAAFGIEGIILFGECVDLYNSKTLRATAQNMFKIPIIKSFDYEFIKKLKSNHTLIATVVDCENNFFEYKFKNNFILALGSEANGLSDELKDLSDVQLTFKMQNGVESLNLATCASVAFALSARQG